MNSIEWEADCLKYRGRILNGVVSHWCERYDGLPVDETCSEWEGCKIAGCCKFIFSGEFRKKHYDLFDPKGRTVTK